jgi:hypothetical protein
VKAYPYVPIGGEMGANCAMLTYGGAAHFGFSCDVHAAPEPHLLPKFLRESVEEMLAAFQVKNRPKRRKKSVKKPVMVPAKPAAEKTTPEPELARVGD